MKQEIYAALGDLLPNPDCEIAPESLDATREICKEIIAELETFCSYCEAKSNAMRCRLNGNINSAMKFERVCEIVYKKLTNLKW